jgi:hypothetical protein
LNQKLRDLFKTDNYLYFYQDSRLSNENNNCFGSIFSQKSYDLNDYEITTKVQRDYLAKKLKEFSYKWTRGNELASSDFSEKIIFPKFKYRELYPQKMIESLDSNNLIILSPTLLAIHLLFTKDDPNSDLLDLINSQPINYKKIAKLLPEYEGLISEIGTEQEILLKRSPLIYRQELDTTF